MAGSERNPIDTASLVKAHRVRLGLSVAAFARAIGVSSRSVHRWEAGEFRVHELWLRRMEGLERTGQAELAQPEEAVAHGT